MENKISLIWKTRSRNSIKSIYQFIAKNNPQNAETFVNRMFIFGQSLTVIPEKFAPCRFEKFAQNGYHCAVFEKNFIFLYKIKDNTLYICNIIRTSRLRK